MGSDTYISVKMLKFEEFIQPFLDMELFSTHQQHGTGNNPKLAAAEISPH